ncbi:MAG: helix-turn-helix transcriptional regulator [Streptomyces sp.]|nr:helix-turn-helix transcriptional regulator [Streptomyces sp.]
MPERTHDFGHYGARGIKGHEAVARQLDRLVEYIRTPITQPRGLLARLRYLTKSPASRAAAKEAGLTVTDRTLREWERGMRKPNKANLSRIENAYREVRRQRVVRDLTRRLNRDGRGTRIEIHPMNQSQVSPPHMRPVEYRTLNVRDWDGIVHAWAEDDDDAMEAEWIDMIEDLGSNWGQYEYVTNVGFAA